MANIKFRMRVLLGLCFLAVVAQAADIDWSNVFTIDPISRKILSRLDEVPKDRTFPTNRVTGGIEATEGLFPSLVALFSYLDFLNGYAFCGGSLLSSQYVMTAAHCVDVASKNKSFLVLGAHDLRYPSAHEVTVMIDDIIVNEGWDPSTLTNDIGLLKLKTPVEFNDWIQPMALPSSSMAYEDYAHELGTVFGRGKTSDSATSISPIPYWASNPILSNAKCNKRWSSIVPILGTHICLDGKGGRSACNGDSGGPLTVTNSTGHPIQVGIVSFGMSQSCASGWPSVYTRVSEFSSWIEETTGSLEVCRE